MNAPFARLKLPARVESLNAFLKFARQGAASAGIGSDDMDRLDLVLEEILVNVARYAYEGGTGEVEVAYAAQQGKLLVEVSDKGRSFNPLEATPPDLSLNLADRPIGGLGVVLVKEMVGSLAYRREDGQNTLSFLFPGPGVPRG